MRNSHRRSAHEHLLAMGVAIVLVAAVSIGINQSGLLTADVLHGDIVSAAAGDISYHAEGSMIQVTSEKTFDDVTSLTFMLVYNPETVTLNAKEIKTMHDFTSSSGKEGVVQVTVFPSQGVKNEQQLVIVPFSGNAEDITVSDATVLFKEGTIDRLAIKKQ